MARSIWRLDLRSVDRHEEHGLRQWYERRNYLVCATTAFVFESTAAGAWLIAPHLLPSSSSGEIDWLPPGIPEIVYALDGIGYLGEVLSEQTVGVLIGTRLPRASRIAEVNIDVRRQAKAAMIPEFLATVPSERFIV